MSKEIAVLAFDVETTGSMAYHNEKGEKTWMIAAGFQLVAKGESVAHLKCVFEKPEWGTFEPECKTEFWDEPLQKAQLDNYMHEGRSATELMLQVHNFFREAQKKYNVITVIDSTFDTEWIQLYLREYGPPEGCCIDRTSEKKYTGFPHVTDDQYRGWLKTTDVWGLEKQLETKMPNFKKFESADHDPVNDALEIAMNYWRYLEQLGYV